MEVRSDLQYHAKPGGVCLASMTVGKAFRTYIPSSVVLYWDGQMLITGEICSAYVHRLSLL